MNFVGTLHAGPTIMAEASAEQQAEHLPRILRGEEVWCQGFSEAGSGSDLASLSCKGVRDGDEYVVTGEKIWTSFAQVADWCELLIRTDPEAPKHKGITWVMFPMDTPGIEIRPIETIVGSSEFSEVFFDEARVPIANRVGPRERRLARRHGHLRLRAGHRLRVRPGRDRPAAVRAGRAGPAWSRAGRHRVGRRRPAARDRRTCRPRWTRCGP